MMLEGGCNCKAIRYRIDATPVMVAQCHCRNCQRQSGSAFSINVVVPAAKVTITGDLTTYVDHDTASGNPVYRRFCGQCGSPIFSDLHEGNGLTIVKAGTLDDPGAFVPALSVWTSTALPWIAPLTEAKAFACNPG